MDKIQRIWQDLKDFSKYFSVTVSGFAVLGAGCGLIFGTVGPVFGWVVLDSWQSVLGHVLRLILLAAVEAAGIWLLIKCRKQSRDMNVPAEQEEPSAVADAEAIPHTPEAVIHPEPLKPESIKKEIPKPEPIKKKISKPEPVREVSAPRRTQPRSVPPTVAFLFGKDMEFSLVQEKKGLHLMHRPRDRYDRSPAIDRWLEPDYFGTHSVDEFCRMVESLCAPKQGYLDRGLIAKKLLDAKIISGTFPSRAAPSDRKNADASLDKNSVDPVSRYQIEAPYLLWLGDADLRMEKGWGQEEYYAVDTRTGEPCYVITQHDGRYSYWFDTFRRCTWEEAAQNARGNWLKGMDQSDWQQRLFQVRSTSDYINLSWSVSARVIYENRIDLKDGVFSLFQGGNLGPDDRTGFGKSKLLTPEHLKNVNRFREALDSKYEFVFEQLWAFVQEKRKSLFRSAGKGNDGLAWEMEGGMLTVRGNGKLESLWNTTDVQRQTAYDPHSLGPWYDRPGFADLEASLVRIMILEEGIDGISELAFHGMKNLQVLHIPASVKDLSLPGSVKFTVATYPGSAAAIYCRQMKLPLDLVTAKNTAQKPASVKPRANKAEPCTVATAKVTPVVQQHYWGCFVELQYDDADWNIKITDVFAVNRWQDEVESCTVKLPSAFPDMTAEGLADFVNSIGPGGPGYGGHRAVKAKEVEPLLNAARDYARAE